MAKGIKIETRGDRLYFAGNTFAAKEQIKAAGGKWDAAAKQWWMPASQQEQADHLLATIGNAAADSNRSKTARKYASGYADDVLSGKFTIERLAADFGRDSELMAAIREELANRDQQAAEKAAGRNVVTIMGKIKSRTDKAVLFAEIDHMRDGYTPIGLGASWWPLSQVRIVEGGLDRLEAPAWLVEEKKKAAEESLEAIELERLV